MPTLHLQVCAGFANRLRAMVSGICLARQLQIPLVIHWFPRSPECVCRFESVLDPRSLPKTVTIVSDDLFQAQEILNEEHTKNLLAEWNRQSDIVIKSYGIFYKDTSWEETLRSIRPSPSVRLLLERTDWNRCIGVHIRRTDNKKSIEYSPTDWFLEKMRATPDCTFVVATDDTKLREGLKAEFGERCVFLAKVLSRRSEEGMISGVADFFGLAKCSKIWGSVGSSFSEIAARYGAIPLELANP